MYQLKLEQFEGPLDLLLKLIEEEKLKINDISLAVVTNRYLEYLNSTTNLTVEELADFLTIAAKLILIKSRTLLPSLVFEEEGFSLEKQLKIYKEYYDASKVIEKIAKNKSQSFSRQMPFILKAVKFIPPFNFSLNRLKEIFQQVLKNLEFLELMPKAAIEKTLNITEKIELIKKLIIANISFGFSKLLRQAQDRTELVVSFLAVLELVKQRIIIADQKNLFEEIKINKWENYE